MCLIVVSTLGEHWVLAANRDEYHARPAQTAAPWPGKPVVLGGRDLGAGGSWLLAEAHGRLAALSNYRGYKAPPDARSRGEIVTDFIYGDLSATAFVARLRQRRERYAGFNLVLQHQGQWWTYCSVSDRLGRHQVGWFAVCNGDPADIWPKMRWTGKRVHALHRDAMVDPDRVFTLLQRRSTFAADLPDTGLSADLERALSSPFIALPGYGTRCSSLVCGDGEGAKKFRERSYNERGAEITEYLWNVMPEGADPAWRAVPLQELRAIE